MRYSLVLKLLNKVKGLCACTPQTYPQPRLNPKPSLTIVLQR